MSERYIIDYVNPDVISLSRSSSVDGGPEGNIISNFNTFFGFNNSFYSDNRICSAIYFYLYNNFICSVNLSIYHSTMIFFQFVYYITLYLLF